MKTKDGKDKGKTAKYCRVLKVSRQGFYGYLKYKDRPWKYKWVADLIKRDFKADQPLEKCVTDITEIKCSDGKLYTSAIFDCFDAAVLGLAMDTNMKAPLCVQTLKNAYNSFHDCSGLERKDENG